MSQFSLALTLSGQVNQHYSLSTSTVYNTILSMDALTVLISHWHDQSLGTIDLLINLYREIIAGSAVQEKDL